MRNKYLSLFVLILNVSISLGQSSSAIKKNKIALEYKQKARKIKDGSQHIKLMANTLFIANKWGIIFSYNISSKNSPKLKFVLSTKNGINSFDVSKSHIYVADQLGNLSIYRYTATSANHVKTMKISTSVTSVDLQGELLYLTLQKNGVVSYSVSKAEAPVKLKSDAKSDWNWFVKSDKKNVYVVDKRKAIRIYNESLSLISEIPNTRDQIQSLIINNGRLYIANGADGIRIVNIEALPAFKDEVIIPVPNAKRASYIYSVYKYQNFLYASDNLGFLYIFNVSDPAKPTLDDKVEIGNKAFDLTGLNKTIYLVADKEFFVFEHNNAPKIDYISNLTVNENKKLSIKINIKELDNNSYKTSVSNLPKGMIYRKKENVLVWTPSFEQSGKYEKVKVSVVENTEDNLKDSIFFDINVNHVNRTPKIGKIKNFKIKENEKLSFKIPKASDEDKEDINKLRYYFLKVPKGASFFEKTLAFNWVPQFDQAGRYELTYGVQDADELRHQQKVIIDVLHVDRKPVIKEIKDQLVEENAELEFKIIAEDPDKEDQKRISITAKGLPKGAKFNSKTLTFKWKPGFTQSGDYKVTFTIRSGKKFDSKTAKIKVNNTNRPPRITTEKSLARNENETIKFKVKVSDPDREDRGKLVVEAKNLPRNAVFDSKKLTFSWKPGFDQSGEYKVDFEVKDSGKLSAKETSSIVVHHVNRSPIIGKIKNYTISEMEAVQFKVEISDPDVEDKGKLKIETVNLPKGAVFSQSMMTFRWQPDYDQSGNYKNIRFKVSDSKLSKNESFNINVKHVNRKPQIDFVKEHNLKENETVVVKISVNDPDKEDKGKLKVSLENAPKKAVLNQKKLELHWKPGFGDAGVYDNIKLTVRDPAGLQASNFTKFNVDNVNRTPSLNPIKAVVANEKGQVRVEFIATDPDKDDQGNLVFETSVLPQGAFVTGNILEWLPDYDQAGSYNIKVFAKDKAGESANREFTITIKNVNRKPSFKSLSDQVINEGDAYSYKFDLFDADKEDLNKLTVSGDNLPGGAKILNNALEWQPGYDQAGDYTINLTVRDAGNLSDKAKLKIQVNNTNRKPKIEALGDQSVQVGLVKELTLVANDDDKEDIEKLRFHAEGLTGLSINKNILSFKADTTHIGKHTIKVHVSDGKSTDQTVFNLTVTE